MGLKEPIWVIEVPIIALSSVFLFPCQVKYLNDPKNESSRERKARTPQWLLPVNLTQCNQTGFSGCSGYKAVLIA